MAALKDQRHEAFAQHVASGATATAAAQLCGFKGNNARSQGSRWLRRSDIAARVAEMQQLAAEKVAAAVAVDKTWVIEQLVENVRMAKQAVPVLDNEGAATGEYKQELPAANRALELIGKEFGMFADKSKEQPKRPLDALTDEQLDRVLTAVAAQLTAEERAALGLAGTSSAPDGKRPGAVSSLH